MANEWLFEDPPNVAVFTSAGVMKGGMPILHVSHDDDDGAWQFHSGQAVEGEQAMIVALREIVKLDPSVQALVDLPYGWIATRASATSEWKRAPHP
jgi:hypothetical protein